MLEKKITFRKYIYHLVYHCFIFINYFLIAIGIDISDCVDTLFK